uniref:Interferon-induced GTP-binding protein Mx n=1 Tax=Pygocentrus nattereri TaxID=42514 RepID=A0AAR2IVL9_PYGNA
MGSTLNEQYEQKVRPCIDLIDSLRSLGVEKDLALPAIAVIGDQSSGKSSVLEALSGVALPRGSGIVTRCPLELKMKRSKEEDSWYGKISYQGHEEELDDPVEVEKKIREAQDEMAGVGVGISDDLISLEITSADVPDLTLIDLPGIARVAVKGQPEDIGDQIKRLIRKFITKQETISLVVVPCNVDIATTEALKMAQVEDPNGERTLGILTKPDLVDKGTEETVVDIVHNEIINLTKGYMIVRCRGQKEIMDRLSLTDAMEKEKAFFKDHAQFSKLYDEGKATIPKLAEKLTLELVNHIERIEKEVNAYEEKYRGRELPGFINYKTFEVMVKEQIKKLEEPAIRKLKEVSDLIRKSFIELAQSSFAGFPNLLKTAKTLIDNIKQEKETEAETLLRTQFKMEQIVYTQDSMYSQSLSAMRHEEEDENEEYAKPSRINGFASVSLISNTDNHATLQELMRHLKSYYNIVSTRLADQVPLVMRYLLLEEMAKQLQRDMLQLMQDKDSTDELLKEDYDIGSKRANLLSRQKRLMQARSYLVNDPGYR